MPNDAATRWERSPQEYLDTFWDYIREHGVMSEGEKSAVGASLHALRMHQDNEAKTFANLGYLLGRFERIGEGETPPIYMPEEVWNGADKSLADYPGKRPTWTASLALLFMTTKELFELDGEDALERHAAAEHQIAYPALQRNLQTDPLTEADRPRHQELTTAFRMGTATWTSQSWYERAQQVPGEVRATSIYKFATPEGARFGHLAEHMAYIDSRTAMTRIRMDGRTAHLEEIVVPGRFRQKRLHEPPSYHVSVLRTLLRFETVILPSGAPLGGAPAI